MIVVRVPGNSNHQNKFKKFHQSFENPPKKFKNLPTDLTKVVANEEDKIFMMMMQSTANYNQSFSYQNFTNAPPSNYVCRRCRVPGHWIQKCPLNPSKSHRFDPKTKMTGIPISMRFRKEENLNFQPKKVEIFDENLVCPICREIFRNPTRTPCCRKTFCYDCIESSILRSDEHECAACSEKYLMLSQLEMNEEISRQIFKVKN